MLCELLPVGLPSLALCLLILSKGLTLVSFYSVFCFYFWYCSYKIVIITGIIR